MAGRGSKSKSKPKPKADAPPRAPAPAVTPRIDRRRQIYAALDLLFAAVQAVLIWKVIPNRNASATFHLWTLPIGTAGLAVGMLLGGPRGWKIGLASGSLVLLSTILIIARILVSAAFLAGVYGAFGKAAAMTSLVAVALIIEVVALLPIVQVKYLMSRAGRRVHGVPAS